MNRFFAELVTKLKKLAEDSPNERSFQSSFNRGHNYLSPENFYNHGSKTFLKNKRKGIIMPRIKYIKKSFRSASLELISKANSIIAEYKEDNLKLTLRQLYYQFVSRNIIRNKQSEYKRVGAIISDARLAGHIDWRDIEDRTRNVQELQHWVNPGEIVRAAAVGYRIDHWQNQEFRPEVWIEKDALTGVIEGICKKLDVAFFACKGYVSQSEMWSSSRRFQEQVALDQAPVIVHLGDHDPSGMDMTHDINKRQELFMGALVVKRIALNMDQIDKYDPPPNPAKLSDSRCHAYIRDYGSNSWELDALEPRVLRDLIEQTVLSYRDDSILLETLKIEQEHKDILNRVDENWETL